MVKQKQPSVSNKNKKQIIVPVLMALILLGSLSYLIYRCVNTLRITQANLAEESRKEKAIGSMQELQNKEGELLKVFPNIQKKNDIIEEVAGWARKEGLDVTQIEPKESTLAKTNFRQLILTLSGKGGYLPITRFLKRVESSPYFVLTSGLQLNGFDLRSSVSQRYRAKGQEEAPVGKDFKVTVYVFLLQ